MNCLTARRATRARRRLSFQAQVPDRIQKGQHMPSRIYSTQGACFHDPNDAHALAETTGMS